MILHIKSHMTSFEHSVPATYEGIKSLFDMFPFVEQIVAHHHSLNQAVEEIVEYLNSHHMDAWLSAEAPLQKSKIQKKELSKAAPQAKFTKLLPANQRPEQDVKRVEPGVSDVWEVSVGHAKMTSPEKPTSSEKVATKQLSYAYDKTGGKDIVRQIRKDPSVAIHDPYATGVSVASTKAPDEVVAHEAHHRTVTKLVVKYGLDKVHKLYDNMIQLIPNDVQRMLTSTLKNVPNYNAMHGSPDPRQRLAFKEEMVNLLRDFTTGKEGGRRRFLKDYASAHYGSPEQFNKLDNVLKNTWQKVQDFANNATEDHMR